MSQLQLDNLLQAASAPEVRLPDHNAARTIHNSFYVVVACILAIGTTPFFIAWAAASLLK